MQVESCNDMENILLQLAYHRKAGGLIFLETRIMENTEIVLYVFLMIMNVW